MHVLGAVDAQRKMCMTKKKMAAIRAELAEGDHERVGLGQVLAVGSGFGGRLKWS